jgi:hypothetical protein
MNRPEDNMRYDRNWTVDKHIPVALLIGLLIQTGGAFWWASSVTTRVAVLEEKYVTLAPLIATLAELRTTLADLKDDVKDIKTSLRPLPPK